MQKRLFAGLAGALALFATSTNAQIANQEELMKPFPNPAWNAFELAGYDTTEIAPGLYSFRYQGTRNIFLVTDDGVIATDPISVEAAPIYREEIRKVTDQPVKYVVYSHNHWDHAPGGQIFKNEGAQFVSHENCVTHFEAIPNPDIVMPDITFSETYTLELGGRSLELLYFGPGHSDCLVVMRPDPGDYLFIVDLLTPGGVPLSYLADNYPNQWLDTLKAIEAIDYKAMIGGHGVPLADPSAVTERRIYVETLMELVKQEVDAGTSFAEIAEIVKPKMTAQFSYMRNFERNIDLNIQRILTFYGIGW